MSLTWSSPVRRGLQGQALAPIPGEIYLHIFGYLDDPDFQFERYTDKAARDKRTLSNVAMACRYFCSLMAPRIFKTLWFQYELPGNVRVPNYSGFCRAVIKNENHARSLASHVRHCMFRYWEHTSNTSDWARTGLLKVHSSALSFMPNLTALSFFRVAFTPHALRSIGSLEQLTELTVELCTFPDCKAEDFGPLSRLRLQCLKTDGFSLHCSTPARFWSNINFDRLLSLTTTATTEMFKRVMSFANLLPLEHLVIQSNHYDVLEGSINPSFFKCIPSLTHLCLVDLTANVDPSNVLHLNHVECAPSVAPTLITGRPVSTIGLSSESLGPHIPFTTEDISRIWAAIPTSTAPIRKLTVSLENWCGQIPLIHMSEVLPNLEEFHVKAYNRAIDIVSDVEYHSAVYDISSSFKDIPPVCVVFPAPGNPLQPLFDLSTQVEAVIELGRGSPRMQTLRLAEIRWTRGLKGEWEPELEDWSIFEAMRDEWRKIDGDKRDTLDYGGYWKSIFGTTSPSIPM
ncbi:hypothetical protein FA15DRAFT_698338 [Coprinopsis marcescibilis]|uniref:F-box domain-containing protein n=1 Tax=Coprinopsis marcescibilis TaxID=230819 RepID=A0A5C3KDC1_COPMA|nr:hypothetical protein FA15DRAFT_698338 [Coprinopsis marcescibilis]